MSISDWSSDVFFPIAFLHRIDDDARSGDCRPGYRLPQITDERRRLQIIYELRGEFFPGTWVVPEKRHNTSVARYKPLRKPHVRARVSFTVSGAKTAVLFLPVKLRFRSNSR